MSIMNMPLGKLSLNVRLLQGFKPALGGKLGLKSTEDALNVTVIHVHCISLPTGVCLLVLHNIHNNSLQVVTTFRTSLRSLLRYRKQIVLDTQTYTCDTNSHSLHDPLVHVWAFMKTCRAPREDILALMEIKWLWLGILLVWHVFLSVGPAMRLIKGSVFTHWATCALSSLSPPAACLHMSIIACPVLKGYWVEYKNTGHSAERLHNDAIIKEQRHGREKVWIHLA